MGSKEDRLPGRILLRLARRLASATVCERVLTPLLADYQFEYRRARGPLARVRIRTVWLMAFWRLLGIEVLCTAGQHLRSYARGKTADDRAEARRLLRCVALAGAWGVLLLVIDLMRRPYLRQTPVDNLVLLLPGVLGLALPIACLFGVIVASHGRPAMELRIRSLLGIAAMAGLATFVLLAWVTPQANLYFREREVSRAYPTGTPVPHGDREMSIRVLAGRAAALHAASRSADAARFELELHKKPALAAWCLALALSGAAMAHWMPTRSLRWLAAMGACWVWFVLLRVTEQAVDAGRLSAALGMWTPLIAATGLALAAIRRARKPVGL